MKLIHHGYSIVIKMILFFHGSSSKPKQQWGSTLLFRCENHRDHTEKNTLWILLHPSLAPDEMND